MTGLWWRSLIAMLLSLGSLTVLLCIITAFVGMMEGGSADKVARESLDAFWMGLIFSVYPLMGWPLFVLPFTWFEPGKLWLRHPKYCEIRWAVLGVLSFNIINLALSPGFWEELIPPSWIPALIGVVAGGYFRWLTRRARTGVRVDD